MDAKLLSVVRAALLEAAGDLYRGSLPDLAVRAAAIRTLGLRQPLIVSWVLTHRCNLRCRYCSRFNPGEHELDTATLLRLMNKFVDRGMRIISLTGGEPLAHPDIDIIIDALYRRGVRIYMNSNGQLADRHVDALRRVRKVTLTLDGPQDVYEQLKGAGTFSRLLEAYELLKGGGVKVRFTTPLTTLNANRVQDIIALCDRLGSATFFQPPAPIRLGSARSNPFYMEPAVFASALKQIIICAGRSKAVANSAAGLHFMQRWPELPPIRCWGSRLFCRVEPDGSLKICGRKDPPVNVDLTVTDISDALPMIDPGICPGCDTTARNELNMALNLDIQTLFSYFMGRW